MGGAIGKGNLLKHCFPASGFEGEIVDAMQQRALQGSTMRSLNGIILKFPRIDESLRNCKTIFEEFDVNSKGIIDAEELKHCFQKLGVSFTEEKINALFAACDINKNRGIEFNEFIVLLCIVYLLQEKSSLKDKSRMGLPHLEATFETLVDAFVFLDKNKDGYVSKNEMIEAMNETSVRDHHLAMKRFEEMDWNKDGTVSFKEFLFTFTRWIGMDEFEDEGDE